MHVTSDYLPAAFLGLVAVLTLGCGDSTGPGPKTPPVATTGAITITATTTGVDRDPEGYNVEVRSQGSVTGTHVRVPLNGTATIFELPPAIYLLTMSGLVPNCEPLIASPRTVTVTAGSATPVALDVTCVTPTQIAYVEGVGTYAEIYVVNSNGTGVSRITTQPGADVNPTWSPDGSRIAFASERDGNFEIYVMSANGANPVRLTNNPAADYRPAWSPDGARIAFVSERDGNAEIYVMNADGTNPRRLTTHNARDVDPAWSPDGTRIAFVSDRDGNAEVYLMGVDGSALRRLTVDNLPDARPEWSPDGTTIAFSRGNSFNSQIYVMKADGSGVTQLTQFVSNGSEPAWSPDGRKIALTEAYSGYYCYESDCTLLQIVRTDGTAYLLVVGDRPSEPAWRP